MGVNCKTSCKKENREVEIKKTEDKREGSEIRGESARKREQKKL